MTNLPQTARELPELPAPIGLIVGRRLTPANTQEFFGYFEPSYDGMEKERVYTSSHMRAYARTAVESALARAVPEWSDDLRAVLDAASEASQVPLTWLANEDFSPEQTKAWLCEAVDATVEQGAFSGSLHQVAEEETGHVVAFTGCGPKSAANAKFLIWCVHFILKHRDALAIASTPTPAPPAMGEDDSLMTEQQAGELLKPIRRALGKLHAEIGWYADEYTKPAEEAIDAIDRALTTPQPQTAAGGVDLDRFRALAQRWRDLAEKFHKQGGDISIAEAAVMRNDARELLDLIDATPTQPGEREGASHG